MASSASPPGVNAQDVSPKDDIERRHGVPEDAPLVGDHLRVGARSVPLVLFMATTYRINALMLSTQWRVLRVLATAGSPHHRPHDRV